jgi:hypothetical protein
MFELSNVGKYLGYGILIALCLCVIAIVGTAMFTFVVILANNSKPSDAKKYFLLSHLGYGGKDDINNYYFANTVGIVGWIASALGLFIYIKLA